MTFCFDPFKSLNITAEGISSCCVMPTWEVDNIDFQNDATLQEIRNQWNKNTWPAACYACKKFENEGFASRRQAIPAWMSGNNVTDTSVELIRLDYWCGNMCNLRCAICGPENSIAWQKELGILKSERTRITNHKWDQIDISKLKWVHFNGGEPLLNKEHLDLLKAIPVPENVILNYNTNGTVRASVELIALWEKFKLVQLDFSIDDIGERFEYQRYPASWDEVVSNLDWYRDTMPVNIMFDIAATVSILNASNQHNIQAWFSENFSTNRVTDPIRYRTQPAYGVLAVDGNAQNAKNYLDQIDKRRGTSWAEVFPELAPILNKSINITL